MVDDEVYRDIYEDEDRSDLLSINALKHSCK